MQKDDFIRLRHMLDAVKEATSFVRNKTRSSLDTDRQLVLSPVKSIEIVGEAAAHVSEKCFRDFPQIPWRDIIGMRNRLINEGVRAMRAEMERGNLYPPIFFTYPYLQDAVRVVLFNTIRATEWDKVSHYLTHTEKYVTNEKVRGIVGIPDTSKTSRLLKHWVDQGLLIKIDTGAKKTVKYRLPIDKEQDSLFVNSGANKS